jgi:demethylmenaquinone methyltransferase / 2-methoxy-6-polyprenyl-1,4-benzoquinol methylase
MKSREAEKSLDGKHIQDVPLHPTEAMVHIGYREIPAGEKAAWVSGQFDAVAGRYDFMNSLLSLGIHHVWKSAAVRMMGLKEGDRVLDLCGGTGDLALRAAPRVGDRGRVINYDINHRMMSVSCAKVQRTRLTDRIYHVRGDAERIAFPADVFDAAMVGFGIRNLTRLRQGFGEMRRVLKPGGTMMCLEFSRPAAPWFRRLYDFYSFRIMPRAGALLGGTREAYTYLPESIRLFPPQDELAALLTDMGYQAVRYRNLTGGIAAVHLAVK